MTNDESPQHLHLLSSVEAGWDGLHLIYELEPADEMPEMYLHSHFIVIADDDFRASYILNGTWQHVDYAKGDIAIIPATQIFPRTQVDREVPLIELFLEPATISRTAQVDIEEIEIVAQLHLRDPLIQQIGLALKAELAAGGVDSRLYAESMATALSAHLLSRYSTGRQVIQQYSGGLPQYKLRQVIVYIDEHLEQNLSLAELALVVQMSPHYFATLFKQSTGLSPHQYVTKRRIEAAQKLLLKSELTIVEICHQVGFQNQSHFTRVFRQYTTKTPKVYRDERYR